MSSAAVAERVRADDCWCTRPADLVGAGHVYDAADVHGLEPWRARALHLGPGRGELVTYLARHGFAMTAIERDQGAAEALGKRIETCAVEVDVHVAEPWTVPAADAAFDLVVAFGGLDDRGQRPAVLAEARRVLAPGGLFVFDLVGRRRMPGLAAREVRAALRQAGLRPGAITALDAVAGGARCAGHARAA